MEHKIIDKEEFLVVGLPVKISLKDKEYQKKIKAAWEEFIPRVEEIKNRKNELFYGVCNISKGIEGDECSFEHICGVEVSSAEDIPEGMISQAVPEAKYYVVTHKGKMETIGNTYYALEKEFKKEGIEEDRSKIFFELYDERFKENSDESEVDIYSPIKQASEKGDENEKTEESSCGCKCC